MMKFLLLTFVSTSAFAMKIPLQTFDQFKLEGLLRAIPSALVRVENHQNFERKFYKFPKSSKPEFLITCYADYYRSSRVPSFTNCDLKVNQDSMANQNAIASDEVVFKMNDRDIVSELFAAIPYSDKTKKFYSGEYFDAVAQSGKFQNVFRYSLVCSSESCTVTFSPKANPQ